MYAALRVAGTWSRSIAKREIANSALFDDSFRVMNFALRVLGGYGPAVTASHVANSAVFFEESFASHIAVS